MKPALAAAAVLSFTIFAAACHSAKSSNDGLSSKEKAAAIHRDFAMLTGEWQLVRAVVDGVAVPEDQVRKTVLITDGGTFRFPQASGVGTHPAGSFTINPEVTPHQVDSTAIGGANAGQVTLGIYEIIDANNKRACWAPPGLPRPNAFEAPAGSHRILQYWRKIGPVPASAPASAP